MFQLKNIRYYDILSIEQLEIPDQTITCIIGTSGGGKTTFLKLLNNMITPDQGQILFKGQDLQQYDPIELRRRVPMLPQEPVVFPGTIRDNLEKAAIYLGIEGFQDSTYRRLLREVSLNQGLDEDAATLSGGEKQRLALARILLLEPEILLLDEPSSALDEETETRIINYVTDYIRQQQGTLVMVTHSREIARNYGEKIVEINEGIISDVSQQGVETNE